MKSGLDAMPLFLLDDLFNQLQWLIFIFSNHSQNWISHVSLVMQRGLD
jgi:hypothetical protein